MSKDTQEMPQLEANLPRHAKKERGTNKNRTNSSYETGDAQTKKNCNRGTALERSVGKLLCVAVGEMLRPVLIAQNPTLNSDAAPN